MTDVTAAIPGPPFPGVYQHYKGDFYIVHKIVSDSTNNRPGRLTGTIFVLYESLGHKTLNVREIREFNEKVHRDGSPGWEHHTGILSEPCDECVPRFKLLNLNKEAT